MTAKVDKIDFDKSLQSVEEIIKNMESGEMPLDKMLESFEKGVNLIKKCQNVLNKAEQKVQKLIEDKNRIIASPMDEGQAL